MPHTGRTIRKRNSENEKPYDRPKQSLLGRLGDRLRVALTPSFLQSHSSTGHNSALPSYNVADDHQTTEQNEEPFQNKLTQLIEVEAEGYVARFDSDVVNGDGVVMQSAHSGRSSQLHKDISGNEAQLTSYAVLTRKPVSNIKQSMLNDGTSEQTLFIDDNSSSVIPCTLPQHLSAVSTLSHKFNIRAFATPSTKISNEPAVLPQILQKSPYYNGYTTYGGRAAYQQSGYGSPYKTVSVVRHPVTVSPSRCTHGTSGVTSLTAKRILEALESHSHKHLAVQTYASDDLESPLSFNTSVYKRQSSNAAVQHQTRPPVREQLIPAVNVISQSRATFNSTLGQQPAASHSVTAEEQSRYSAGGGKMKHSKFYSSNREHSKNFTDHVTYELPEISVSSQFPADQRSAVPEFSFCPPLDIFGFNVKPVPVSDSPADKNFSFVMPQQVIHHVSDTSLASSLSSDIVRSATTASPSSAVTSVTSLKSAHSLASYQFSVTGAIKKQNAEVQMTGQRESSSNAASALCQGSVLDVLCPLGMKSTAAQAIDSVTEPAMPELFTAADDEWKCKNCGVQNGATSEECVKCQSGRLHVMSHMNYNIANESAGCIVSDTEGKTVSDGGNLPSLSEMFRRRDDEWTCDVCMVSNKLTATQCVACCAPPPASKPQGSDVSASAHVKPVSTFNTGCDNVLAFSAAETVKHPFSSAGSWNVTGGFKFGALTSQPLDWTVTSSYMPCGEQQQQLTHCSDAAGVSDGGGGLGHVAGQSPLQSASVSTAQSAASRPAVAQLSPSVQAVCSSTGSLQQPAVSNSKSTSGAMHSCDIVSSEDAHVTATVSAAVAAAAETESCHVDAIVTSDRSDVSPSVTSTSALAAAECDSRKSLELASSTSSVTSSRDARTSVLQPVILTTPALLNTQTSSVFSLPLTTVSQQSPSLFSFGQAAFAGNSSRALGVPATSTLQFKAPLCTAFSTSVSAGVMSTSSSNFSFTPAVTSLQSAAFAAVSTVDVSNQPTTSVPVFNFTSGFTTKTSASSTALHGPPANMITRASVFDRSSGSVQVHSTNTSSFGSNTTVTTSESVQPMQQAPFGAFSQSVSIPSFGFGVSSAPVFGFQPTHPLFGSATATCNQQAAVQPSSFSFAAANSSPFVFGMQQSAPSTTPVFSLGKRTNSDGTDGDLSNKRQARGTFAACQTSAAMQPTFAVSSANSNVFTFGGNVQSSMASSVVASTPWNIQTSAGAPTAPAFSSAPSFQFGEQTPTPVFQFSAQASSQSRSAQTIPTSTTQRVFKKAARKLNR